jgi:CRISPR-associated protein Csd1
MSLFKALCKFAKDRGLGEQVGMEPAGLGYVLNLDLDGNLIHVDIYPQKGKERKLSNIPRVVRTSGICPYPGPDGSRYVLGNEVKDKKGKVSTSEKHLAAYVKLVRETAEKSNNPGAIAVARFYDKFEANKSKLQAHDYAAWVHSPGAGNVAFSVDGELVHEQEAMQPVYAEWRKNRRPEAEGVVRCVLTGEFTKPEVVQNKISIMDASGKLTSATMFSYNLPHLLRYGCERGEAAPMSSEAVACWRAGHEYLQNNGFYIRGGNTRTEYFLDGSLALLQTVHENIQALDMYEAEDEEDTTPELTPDQLAVADAVHGKALKKELNSPFSEHAPTSTDYTPFFAFTLTANSGRVMLKQFCSNVAEVQNNIRAYREDLALPPSGPFMPEYPAIKQIAYAFASKTKGADAAKKQAARYIDAIWEAALQRLPLSSSLRDAAVTAAIKVYTRHKRYAANKKLHYLTALIKLGLLRAAVGAQRKVTMTLDAENNNPSYVWGRTFAVMEQVKRCQFTNKAGMDRQDADVRLGSWLSNQFQFAATAQRAAQIRLTMDINGHVQAEAKRNSGGVVFKYLKQLTELNSLQQGQLPMAATLSDKEQFLLGLEHQRHAFYTEMLANIEAKKANKDKE